MSGLLLACNIPQLAAGMHTKLESTVVDSYSKTKAWSRPAEYLASMRRGTAGRAFLLRDPQRASDSSGFSLIETLVAISLLTIAIVVPMGLVAQSLATAFYARDQITAFHLAQEAIESVRSVRDGHILENALGTAVDLLEGIPNDAPFVIDTRDNYMDASVCTSGTCPPLETDGNLYGYGRGLSGWTATRFTRTAHVKFINAPDEIRVSVTVQWRSGSFQPRSFTISENLYRWVEDGSAL
ncbi:MAG: Uncharacterized protein G01um10148_644 [Parcubacteria group bacterium Gr01-1014_8]|nr:MAG: Uncharacterized protein G01um10148_644 [Parcubacteria group bacterium Gr01-1014_8]